MTGLTAAMNNLAFQFMKGIANPALTSFMAFIAADLVVIAALLLLAFYLYYKKDRNVFTFLLAAVLIYVITDIIKIIVHEPRPCAIPSLSWINHVGCDTASFSFPSNHATMLTGLSIFVGAYKYLRIIFVIWLVLVLFGRVYLGAHYITDVIAGVIVGLVLGELFYNYRKSINSFLSEIAKKLIPQLFNITWKSN